MDKILGEHYTADLHNFAVKHYAGDKHPTIKGNGFDGLILGEDREEAEKFISLVNGLIFLIKHNAKEKEKRGEA